QDLVTGYATDRGFNIVAREDVLNAVAAMGGPNSGDPGASGANLDSILSNNTSALRLAQNLNVDYVLICTITSYGTDTQNYRDASQDIDLILTRHQMRTTFKLLDALDGGSLVAGVTTATISDRITPGVNNINRQNLIDDLLDANAQDMAEILSNDAHSGAITEPQKQSSDVTFEVHCGVADMFYPEVMRDERGHYVLEAGHYRLEALAVPVELDGVVIGDTSAPLHAKPGLHKMRLSRDLFKDWSGTVNIHEGGVLTIALEMTDEGRQHFREMSDWAAGLKQGQELKDAQAKALEGEAKYFEQSHIRVDTNNPEMAPAPSLPVPIPPTPPPTTDTTPATMP
ncbi:MAG TPA: PEGA domain-containing protein, partial [Tepidisphaeraceae bacterium]